MRLIVDTSVLVAELLRTSGRTRLADERLELFIPERMIGELMQEMPRRIGHVIARRQLPEVLGDELFAACAGAVSANIVTIDEAIYAAAEEEARRRSVRDPNDWPVVACAVMLSCGVWTNDNDFLGTGVPTWTTESLRLWLASAHA